MNKEIEIIKNKNTELNTTLVSYTEKTAKINNIKEQMNLMNKNNIDENYDIKNEETLDKITSLLNCS